MSTSAKKESPAVNPTPETPRPVRAGAAALMGVGVGALATPLPPGIRVALMVVFLGAGLAWLFSHPYRRDIRAAVEANGQRYTTRVKQIVPLFPVWLALMLLPPFQIDNWAIAVLVWIVAGAYIWQVTSRLDGTRELEEIAAAKARK